MYKRQMQRILKSIKNIQDADVRLQLRDEYEELRRERQKIESRDSMDETYRRLRYVAVFPLFLQKLGEGRKAANKIDVYKRQRYCRSMHKWQYQYLPEKEGAEVHGALDRFSRSLPEMCIRDRGVYVKSMRLQFSFIDIPLISISAQIHRYSPQSRGHPAERKPHAGILCLSLIHICPACHYPSIGNTAPPEPSQYCQRGSRFVRSQLPA